MLEPRRSVAAIGIKGAVVGEPVNRKKSRAWVIKAEKAINFGPTNR
jgi:hypothetical protein